MERVKVLIERLVEQQQQNANAAQMLVTLQLLQNELLGIQQKTSPVSSKVSVVLPSRPNMQAPAAQKPEPEKKEELNLPVNKPVELNDEPVWATKIKEEPVLLKPEVAVNKPAALPEISIKPKIAEPSYIPFDAVAETPTLLHHQPVVEPRKEVYELKMDMEEGLSLNDKLKQEKTEVGQVLKETPIKDLRKAIGINDKFVFVSELFRGDEAMYERSIKTINGFHILPEAEYWINRELKVKLGWNDSKEVVQHFYHLVRRRFS